MIPLSELRIGNYVIVNKKVRKIAMISSFKDIINIPSIGYYVGEDIEYVACNEPHVQPLAINNSLLEKSGFIYDNYFKLWQKTKETTGTGMEMELDTEYSVVDFLRRPILKEVKNIHNLQNLYHALRGKELVFVNLQVAAN